MANIVRCVLPDGVHRFKPFTVADYRDFLLVRNDMNHKTLDEQKESIDELMEDYFSEFPPSWRPYIFLKVFTSSIGKTKIPISYECNQCQNKKQFLFNFHQEPLKAPEVEVAGIKIKFTFPDKETTDLVEVIQDNIYEVTDGVNTYKWKDLDDENKLQIIDAIDIETLEKITQKMHALYFELKIGCCDTKKIVYKDILSIFKLLLHPDEVFLFYQINHTLVKSQYDLDSIMHMMPVERSIALSLVEKDNKK